MAHQLEYKITQPHTRRYDTPLLLLHGAWHGAWCWEDALVDFARRGFQTHTISLRGHGGSDRPRMYNLCGMSDYLRDVHSAVSRISPTPVVVAHSMSGYILQHYLMQQTLPGAVLLCTLPVSGAGRFLASYLPSHPLAALNTLLTANTRHLVGTPQLARDAFFRPDIALGPLLLYSQLLGPESLRMVFDCTLASFPQPSRNRTALLVIAAERDRVFSLHEQQATADAYGAEFVVVPDAAHDLMLDPAWPLAAEAIEQAVGRWESGGTAERPSE